MKKKAVRTLKEIKELAKEPEYDYIEKKAKISADKTSLLVRIPKELINYLQITKGDFFKFYIRTRDNKQDSDLEISLVRGKK